MTRARVRLKWGKTPRGPGAPGTLQSHAAAAGGQLSIGNRKRVEDPHQLETLPVRA